MNIYIGNLSSDVTDDDLMQAFEAYGHVALAKVIRDRFTGESRGFGFIEMPAKAEAQAAMAEMDGKELKGKTIIVNEARPRTEKRRGKGMRGGGGRRPY